MDIIQNLIVSLTGVLINYSKNIAWGSRQSEEPCSSSTPLDLKGWYLFKDFLTDNVCLSVRKSIS